MSQVEDGTALEVTALDNLARECAQISKDHGFHDVDYTQYQAHTITSLALIASEAVEALETYRKNYSIEHDARNVKTGMTSQQPRDYLDELADVVIRTFELAARNGLSLGQAVVDKMDKNRKRPYRHGKTF